MFKIKCLTYTHNTSYVQYRGGGGPEHVPAHTDALTHREGGPTLQTPTLSAPLAH